MFVEHSRRLANRIDRRAGEAHRSDERLLHVEPGQVFEFSSQDGGEIGLRIRVSQAGA